MNIESGILLHMGINFLLAPPPKLDKRHFLAFQSALLDEGIEYGAAKHLEREINLTRKTPPLQIRVIVPSPQIGQLLVVSPRPEDGLEIFGRKAQAIASAFNKTWPASTRIVARDCTIRSLYESDYPHAFEEIWEVRLNQPKETLSLFGAPVGGGGLRFMIPPTPADPDPAEIDVKIESYLKDTKKVYVDVTFKWPQKQPNNRFDPVERLSVVDRFIENKVLAFMERVP